MNEMRDVNSNDLINIEGGSFSPDGDRGIDRLVLSPELRSHTIGPRLSVLWDVPGVSTASRAG
jgi:hypothetical protein